MPEKQRIGAINITNILTLCYLFLLTWQYNYFLPISNKMSSSTYDSVRKLTRKYAELRRHTNTQRKTQQRQKKITICFSTTGEWILKV